MQSQFGVCVGDVACFKLAEYLKCLSACMQTDNGFFMNYHSNRGKNELFQKNNAFPSLMRLDFQARRCFFVFVFVSVSGCFFFFFSFFIFFICFLICLIVCLLYKIEPWIPRFFDQNLCFHSDFQIKSAHASIIQNLLMTYQSGFSELNSKIVSGIPGFMRMKH